MWSSKRVQQSVINDTGLMLHWYNELYKYSVKAAKNTENKQKGP